MSDESITNDATNQPAANTDQPKKSRYHFANLTAEQRFELSQRAGRKAHELKRAHEFTSSEATEAGKKGGDVIRRRYQKSA